MSNKVQGPFDEYSITKYKKAQSYHTWSIEPGQSMTEAETMCIADCCATYTRWNKCFSSKKTKGCPHRTERKDSQYQVQVSLATWCCSSIAGIDELALARRRYNNPWWRPCACWSAILGCHLAGTSHRMTVASAILFDAFLCFSAFICAITHMTQTRANSSESRLLGERDDPRIPRLYPHVPRLVEAAKAVLAKHKASMQGVSQQFDFLHGCSHAAAFHSAPAERTSHSQLPYEPSSQQHVGDLCKFM